MTQTTHVIIDRAVRYERIKKTIGIGEPIAIAPDRKHRDCFNILTNTGVYIVQSFDGTMITLWVATMSQAIDVYQRTTGSKRLPQKIFATVRYNNEGARKNYYQIAA